MLPGVEYGIIVGSDQVPECHHRSAPTRAQGAPHPQQERAAGGGRGGRTGARTPAPRRAGTIKGGAAATTARPHNRSRPGSEQALTRHAA